MDHCSGGEGAHQVDWLGALDAWVTEGKSPSVLAGTHPQGKAFMLPTCPWPQLPKYKGSGDMSDAANFSCAVP
jgi:feruloyl esterase